jgi:hypothetical protein
MAVRLSATHAGRPLLPRNIPGTHFRHRLSRPQGHSAAGRIRSIEESNETDVSEEHITSISGSKNKPSKKPAWKQVARKACFYADFLLQPKSGDMFLRNVSWLSTDYMAYPRRSGFISESIGTSASYLPCSSPILLQPGSYPFFFRAFASSEFGICDLNFNRPSETWGS